MLSLSHLSSLFYVLVSFFHMEGGFSHVWWSLAIFFKGEALKKFH